MSLTKSWVQKDGLSCRLRGGIAKGNVVSRWLPMGERSRCRSTGVNPYAAELLNLCESALEDAPPRLTIDDALWNMRVIDGLHESAHTGQRVAIYEEP